MRLNFLLPPQVKRVRQCELSGGAYLILTFPFGLDIFTTLGVEKPVEDVDVPTILPTSASRSSKAPPKERLA